MLQTTSNITSKYRQEIHYNYVENSDFFASNCSPLLCYRSVTTALTAQIPAETLSQSHRLCFMLLHYHCENHANSYGNAITNSLGFSLFSAFVLSQSLPHKFLRKRLIKILVRENLTTS